MEHSTNHGSMSRTRWAIEGSEESMFELDGHKFGSADDGAPMMCNVVCKNMGRHPHIDYCRAACEEECNGPEVRHIAWRMDPEPSRFKDWITHNLFWKRSGVLTKLSFIP